jgi:hypothetical protein
LDRAADCVASLLLIVELFGVESVVANVQVSAVTFEVEAPLEGRLWPAVASAKDHQCRIDANSRQPGGEPGFSFKGRKRQIRTQESILQGVLSIFPVPRYQENPLIKAMRMNPLQFGKSCMGTASSCS